MKAVRGLKKSDYAPLNSCKADAYVEIYFFYGFFPYYFLFLAKFVSLLKENKV